ncbi:REP element-mobilizing transposase RayT [Peribacillus deserti]|uniref:REP element-mobilizing transposase RayT n=1 Tax=Peribacillus deserti TaxID=673318 RepID=A0ABS2QC29_9BACI|nr:transposase [Peribacillus deserti]MBM7690723.1 REP element-mobilizing transposase RayT [Peribacillus deserti]
MARKKRVWYPGAAYHLICRGNRGADLFLDDKDRNTYLSMLEETREKYEFFLHSYCLMSNHVHLLLQTISDPTGLIMSKLNTRYAIYFNKRYQQDGHVFQGRYYAQMIDSIEYLVQVSRYIHLNPLKAQLVEKPEDYKWSSYQAFLQGKPDKHATPAKILLYFNSPQNYKLYVDSRAGDTTETH